MRENCQSGSMSGNRKQDQVKPDCGDEAKAESHAHRETTVTAPVLDSTLVYTHSTWVGQFSRSGIARYGHASRPRIKLAGVQVPTVFVRFASVES
jgi:hypothetical protein